jgi:transcriptional regulator with XRE-family HTH domain
LAEPIGARLKRLRLQRGLSQRDLSSPGVSYAYISRIEAGARTPSVKALRMLARKLGVSVDYLETGRDIRDSDERELKLADAELQSRLEGDMHETEATLRDILDDARQAGDHLAAERAATVLGCAAARRGNHLDAIEQLEAAIADHPLRPHARPDAYATLGQSYASLGAPERAIQLFERCLAEISEAAPEDKSVRIRFAALLSDALTDVGEFERARQVVRSELNEAGGLTSPYRRVRLLWSLARAAGMEGRPAEALDYARRAISLLEATDDALQVARAYLLSAGIEALEERADEARDDLTSAERLLGAAEPAPSDLGLLRIGQSRLATLEGDAETGIARAREALDILGDSHGSERGTAVWALADGLSSAGEVDSANEAFRRAVDLMTVHGRRHDAARACERWARMLDEAGRTDAAAPVRRRGADLRPSERKDAHTR